MAAMTPFNNLRLYYLNPTPEGAKNRKELANQLALVKLLTFGSGVGGTVTGLFGLGISSSYPIIGNMLLIAGTVTLIASRELYVMAGNVEELCLKNILERGQAILTADQFLMLVYKGTWILGPLTSNLAKRKLTEVPS